MSNFNINIGDKILVLADSPRATAYRRIYTNFSPSTSQQKTLTGEREYVLR